jgi:hypothetical protein
MRSIVYLQTRALVKHNIRDVSLFMREQKMLVVPIVPHQALKFDLEQISKESLRQESLWK